MKRRKCCNMPFIKWLIILLHHKPNLHQHRFLALCLPNESTSTKIAYLVFSCPESAPVRKKMIMSSAKVRFPELIAF